MLRKYYISPEFVFVVQHDAVWPYGRNGTNGQVIYPTPQKITKLCIDKKLAMPNMQLTLINYGGYHDAIGYQARSNLYGGKAV